MTEKTRVKTITVWIIAATGGFALTTIFVAFGELLQKRDQPTEAGQQITERRLQHLETAIKGKADERSTHICYTDAAPFEECIPVAQVLRQLLDEKGVRAEWEGERRIPGKVVFKPVRK